MPAKKPAIQTEFAEKVRAVVRRIPAGKVASYGQIAILAGAPGAARAVGTVMAGNWDPTVPCHRVVAAGGAIGRYNRGETPDHGCALKTALLQKEGVAFRGTKADLAASGWRGK